MTITQSDKPDAAGPGSARLRALKDLPGPLGLPLLGNLLQVDLNILHVVLEAWADRHGSYYLFRLAHKPVLVVSEPALMQQVLKQRPDVYRRLSAIESVIDEMGMNGVFSTEGNAWRRQRQIVTQALSAVHLRRFAPALAEIAERLRQRWHAKAQSGQPVDVLQDLMCYTVDVTSRLTFGVDVDTLGQQSSQLREQLGKIFPMVNQRINAPFPYWRFMRLPRDYALDQALDEIRANVAGLIELSRQRLGTMPDLADNPGNLVEALLVARDDSGQLFTEAEVIANAVTILMAGEDTTANTLAWMIHFLITEAATQERLQQELDQHAADPSAARCGRQTGWIEALMHETMRLKPVAPILFLEAAQDTVLGDVQVTKGTAVFLLTRHAGLSEAACPAATQFIAERWIDGGTPAAYPPPRDHFLPFGAGPRFCPGRSLALLEIES